MLRNVVLSVLLAASASTALAQVDVFLSRQMRPRRFELSTTQQLLPTMQWCRTFEDSRRISVGSGLPLCFSRCQGKGRLS